LIRFIWSGEISLQENPSVVAQVHHVRKESPGIQLDPNGEKKERDLMVGKIQLGD